MASDDMGFFGNIWVRQHTLNLNETSTGHKHHFDHVTLLVSGKVKIQVEERIKEFSSPTFIVIRKNHKHNITAITDNVIYYCVFALRDLDGNAMDFYTKDHDPLSYAIDLDKT